MADAFHLPALASPPTTSWEYRSAGAPVELRVARLTPALLRRQVDALRAARERHLAERPVEEIVRAIDRAALRLADPVDPLRRTAEEALPAVTGYSAPMIRRILDAMIPEWRTEPLLRLLRADLGDPRVLDEFRPRHGAPGQVRAFGPALTTHVFSGNVPGVAVTSMIRSLLVKSATLGKAAAGEPLLPALFARGLAEVDPELGECLAVTYWRGGSSELEEVALGEADAVVVYGGTEAVESVRARTPSAARFLGYGHRLSFGVVAREALSAEADTAARAALEVATFDQQGCVSPHLFYVEEGGEISPSDFARALAVEMERVERELPRGSLSPGESSSIRQLRGEVEFAEIAGSGARLFASAQGTTWTVIYDPDPTFSASCLNRVVRVKPVADLSEVPALAEPVGAFLQTVGVAASADRLRRLAEGIGRLGASRVAPLGSMAWPPGTWHHDGRPPVADLVRWCDLEV